LYEDIVKRLASFGYTVKEPDDNWVLQFLIGKVTNEIKNECNVCKIPAGLHYVAVDMVCGEFLNSKKGTGQLEGFDVEAAVKQVKEGDTSITFAVGDNSITLDGFIYFLMNYGKSQFITFRRLKW